MGSTRPAEQRRVSLTVNLVDEPALSEVERSETESRDLAAAIVQRRDASKNLF